MIPPEDLFLSLLSSFLNKKVVRVRTADSLLKKKMKKRILVNLKTDILNILYFWDVCGVELIFVWFSVRCWEGGPCVTSQLSQLELDLNIRWGEVMHVCLKVLNGCWDTKQGSGDLIYLTRSRRALINNTPMLMSTLGKNESTMRKKEEWGEMGGE